MRALDRLNAALPWSHNDWYAPWVVRQVPPGARRALDVGCGAGTLLRRLAAVVPEVHGIDADLAMVRLARSRTADRPGVLVERRDLRDLPATPSYDLITVVAVLHHLPTEPTLRHLRSLLRPRGRLVIVGCYRQTTRRDHLPDLLAIPANPVIGLLHHRRAHSARTAMSAPTAPPADTLADVRRAATAALGPVRLRRRLFWRYTLTWTRPR